MIAAGFLKAGARAVYISARKAEACDATARELSSLGTCISLPADVSDAQGVQALVAAYTQREPALDILVNNAGAAWGETFDTFPEKASSPSRERVSKVSPQAAPAVVDEDVDAGWCRQRRAPARPARPRASAGGAICRYRATRARAPSPSHASALRAEM